MDVIVCQIVIGALGRLAIPGPDPMTIWQTIPSASPHRSSPGLAW
jgi:hypothetical protein